MVTRQEQIGGMYYKVVTKNSRSPALEDTRYLKGQDIIDTVKVLTADAVNDNNNLSITLEHITEEEYKQNQPKRHMYHKSSGSGMLVA
jgi:hypothetical protein